MKDRKLLLLLVLVAAEAACTSSRPSPRPSETCHGCAAYEVFTVVSHAVGAKSDSFVLQQGAMSLGAHCGWTLIGGLDDQRVSENCDLPPPGKAVYLRREHWKGTEKMPDSLISETGVVLILDWEKSK